MGNDFRSKHTMLVIHVWMIHKRLLMKDIDNGQLVDEAVFDEVWEDTCARIRAEGIGELSVNKHLSEVQGMSFKCCVELDNALTKQSEDEIVDKIGGTLWRFAYNRRPEVDVDHVLELANYVRNEQKSLIDISTEGILKGRFEWGELPKWSYKKKHKNDSNHDTKHNLTSQQALESKLDVEDIWRAATAPDGKTYYWNTKTRESRWDRPIN